MGEGVRTEGGARATPLLWAFSPKTISKTRINYVVVLVNEHNKTHLVLCKYEPNELKSTECSIGWSLKQ